MRKILPLILFLSFSSHATLIKQTYTITNIRAATEFFSNGGINGIPGSWDPISSVLGRTVDPLEMTAQFNNQGVFYTSFQDGANGRGEFGAGDDVVDTIYTKDFLEQQSGLEFKYFSDADINITTFSNLANEILQLLYGRDIEAYSSPDQKINSSIAYSFWDTQWFNKTADAWAFSFRSDQMNVWFDVMDYAGFNNNGRVLWLTGDVELISTEIVSQSSQVPEPASLSLFAIAFFAILGFRRHQTP